MPIAKCQDKSYVRIVCSKNIVLQLWLKKFVFLRSTFMKFCMQVLYSVTGKQCPQALIEKSLVFLTVNLYEILHASTYGIYNYIYKIKKSAADGNPEL